MANEEKAITQVIANMKAKFAEMDILDNEFADLDAALPPGEGIEQFNLLSDKREELEKEIRLMREKVQLISEWEKFKGSGWSDEVQSELNSLDQQFADIADGASSEPMLPPPMPEAPLTPDIPPSPEASADASVSTDTAVESLPDEASLAPPSEPLAPPMASSKNSKMKEKSTIELQDKKGSSTPSYLKKGDTHMANQIPTKPSLKEKLAEVKSRREAISKEAKTRVASAWTIAKTMLPTAPAEVQKSFAASLLNNSTKALTAALRQTAINAHNTKLAETFKQVHKIELNDLLEDPSVLNTEKKAVSSELSGDAKNAGKKRADDRKECGPQEGTYNDGRDGSEPKEIDASKAAERPDAGEKPGQTQNLSDGKNAAAKTACSGKDCSGCKNPDCKGKKAGVKKAEFPPAEGAPAAEEAPLPDEEAPIHDEEEAPTEFPPAAPENTEEEAAEILTDEKKEVLEEKIDEAQAAIKAIEAEIRTEGDEAAPFAELEEGEGQDFDFTHLEEETPEGEEELDFSKVFDQGDMEDKAASLANEGEDKFAGEEDDFFAPSSASSLEASMDDDGMAGLHDMFSMQGADGDPLASLIAGLKTAEQVAGMDVIPSFTGEAAKHFESDEASSDTRDNTNDHDGDLWAEAIEDITPEEQGAKRVKQDSTNVLEKPKAAVLKKIHTASGADKTPRFDIGQALFGADDE